ncbi:MAG: methyltransferase domain-containing protein [Syntrophales bacterium]
MKNSSSKKPCPYCSSAGIYFFEIGKREYFRCSTCDLIFKPAHSLGDAGVLEFYGHRYFDEYSHDELSGKRTNIYHHILDLIECKLKTGNILDVGCGCGFFLDEARRRGWRISGLDPSEKSIIHAEKKLGCPLVKGTLRDFSGPQDYDVVTMINVLDHSVSPWEEVRLARGMLKRDGWIFLRFPNGGFHPAVFRLARKFGVEKAFQRLVVFHEYSFTAAFIRKLLSDFSFSDIEIQNSVTSGNPASGCAGIYDFIFTRLTAVVFKLIALLAGAENLYGPSLEVMARKT